ncbi:UNVERIFIED_ORG: hypothetical protein ABIB13_002223 [Arthrobacter sp. UYEF2]
MKAMTVQERLDAGVGALTLDEFAALEGAPSGWSVYLRLQRGTLEIPTIQHAPGHRIRIPVPAARMYFERCDQSTPVAATAA